MMNYKMQMIGANNKVIDFSFESEFILTSIEMAGRVVNLSMSQGVGQIGGTVQGFNVPYADVPVTGEITGLVGWKRQYLIDSVLPNEPVKFIYNDTWILEGVPIVLPKIENVQRHAKFSFTIRAAYPYWRTQSEIKTELAGMLPMFEYPITFYNEGDTAAEGETVYHMFGKRSESLIVNVLNFGNVPVRFALTLFATTSLSNPQIIHTKTGEFIKINRNMVSGEKIIVDMSVSPIIVKSIIGEKEKNIFGQLDLDSVPFDLDVGDNALKYDADVNPDGLDSWILFQPAVTAPY